jgi:hypothetical protein
LPNPREVRDPSASLARGQASSRQGDGAAPPLAAPVTVPGAVSGRRPLHRRAARHVGRGAHRLIRWVGAVAAVTILILLVAMWRLMQGPIELNWLAPYVEAAIERSGIGVDVAISGVRFGIDRATHQLDLRAENIRISLADGRPVASFPEMAMSFGLGPLLRGWLAPTQLVVERPVLHLTRDAGGSISAQIGSEHQVAGDFGLQLLEQLGMPRQPDTPLGMLRHVRIRGATVIVDDLASGRTWRADRVDVSVERSGKGVRGDISLAVPLGSSMPELRASYRYIAERRLLDLEISIDGVQPAAIPPLIPELAQLRHVEAPVSGTLRTRIDVANGSAQGSRLDLVLGKGQLHSDWLPAGTIAVEKGELRATYAPERDEVRVEALTLDLGAGTEFVLSGSFAGVTPELFAAPADARPGVTVRGDLNAAMKQLPMARLGQLWPTGFARGGRRWTLANIPEGMLDEAALQVVVDLDLANHTANVLHATGRLQYRDATVNYFKGLPPVRKVSGTAAFAQNRLGFTPTGGVIKGLKVTGGSLLVTNLDEPTEWLTVDLAVAGPLQDVLEVIDSKPLHYARAIGLDPAQVGGRAETQLHFRLPLLDDLKLDAIDYSVKATLTGTSIAKVALDRSLRDGNLTLDVARSGAQLRGTARFDDVPAKLDANVFFRPKAGAPTALFRVEMMLDDAVQRRFGLDVAPDRLSGPIALDATYRALAPNRGEAIVQLDLRDTALAIAEAGWKKAPGQPGTAKIVLDLENEKVARIRQIEVSAAGLDGRLTAQLSADRKQLDRVDLRRLTVGDSNLTGTVTRRPGGGWRADIHAARLDARHLIKDATTATPAASPAAASSLPLALNARVDRLVLGPKRELHQVGAELLRSGGVWRSGHIDGRFAAGRRLSLRFGEGGGERLMFQSDDFGATLALLDIADNVVGGRITIDGKLTETGGQRTLRAHVEGENYTVMRASILARLLALPSLTGLASTLTGGGLPFSTLRGDVVYSGSRISIERMLAFGEALGITADGWIDIDRDRLELQGTVAPAYLINSILGHVPIVGQLLGGGSQGLFAANYRLSGALADPGVAVNPLSALAPGFLRQLFAPLVGFAAPAPDQPQAR